MNLFECENEDAIDLLADLLEPACKIMADEGVQKAIKSRSPKLTIIKSMLKGNKKAVIEFMAIINGKKPEEYRCTIPSLIRDILVLLNNPEVETLFQSQGQEIKKPSSGSATENTEADDQ